MFGSRAGTDGSSAVQFNGYSKKLCVTGTRAVTQRAELRYVLMHLNSVLLSFQRPESEIPYFLLCKTFEFC